MDTGENLTLTRPVALIGMMGSGKSVIGQALAQKLSVPFIDSDAEITKRAEQSIAEIFTRRGEAAFRALEQEAILDFLGAPGPFILSTGGGALTSPDVLSAITGKTISVFLKASPEELYERVKNDKNRPLLQQKNPLAVLEKLSKDRAPLYAQAHITIETTPGSEDETLRAVISALSAYLKSDNP